MKQFWIYLGAAALAFALFISAPEIDLATSRLFHDARGGFVLLPLGLVVDFTEVGTAWARFLEALPQWVKEQHVLKVAFVTFVFFVALTLLVRASSRNFVFTS